MGSKKLLSNEQHIYLHIEYHKFLTKAKAEIEKTSYTLTDFFNLIRTNDNSFIHFTDKELSNQLIAFRRVEGVKEWPNLSDLKNYISAYARSFLEKSHQAALLAIEIYNKPLVAYRSEGFIVMMMIAWTALFQTILITEGTQIKYKEGEQDNYLDLRKCIRKYIGYLKKEIEANLELLIELRDKIVHRENPLIDEKLFGYCQACCNNYLELLHEKFGNQYSIPVNLAHSIQFSNKYEPLQLETFKDLKNNYNYKIFDFIKEYEDKLYRTNPEIYRSQSYCVRMYMLPKLVKEKSAEAAIEYIKYDSLDENVTDNIDKAILLIKENRVGGDYFKAAEVCRIVREKLKNSKGENWKFSPSTHHSKAAAYFKIREGYKTADPSKTKKEYCLYDPLFDTYIYTKQWIDFLANKLKDDGLLKEIMKNDKKKTK